MQPYHDRMRRHVRMCRTRSIDSGGSVKVCVSQVCTRPHCLYKQHSFRSNFTARHTPNLQTLFRSWCAGAWWVRLSHKAKKVFYILRRTKVCGSVAAAQAQARRGPALHWYNPGDVCVERAWVCGAL